MYFSDKISGYAIVDTGVAEETCPGYPDPGPYSGTGGIKLNSVFKRMAFALSYLDYNLIGSRAIDDDSRLLSIRRVEDRAKKLAPFLSFDNDPYPVALNGRVLWVIDAYTTSDRYPYGQSGDRTQLNAGSGLDHPFNYVRNSIKVVVDAYDGTVDFYIIDDEDPIAKVWQSAFPGLFKTATRCRQGLDAHLRYPEELFRVQTAAYSKYRLSPEAFFGRTGAWSVAQAPIGRPKAGTSSTHGQQRRRRFRGRPTWPPNPAPNGSCRTTRCCVRPARPRPRSSCCARSCRSPPTTVNATCRRS